MRIINRNEVITTSSSVIPESSSGQALWLDPGISSKDESLDDQTPSSSSEFAFSPQLRGTKGELNNESQLVEYIIKIPTQAKKTDLQDLKTFLESQQN
jgi:hypothetical protein